MFFIKLWKWSSQKTQAAQEKHRPCLQPDSRALYEIYLYEILKFKGLKRWAVWIFDVTGRCFGNRSSSVVAGVTLQTLAHLFTCWVVYLHVSWGSQKLVEKVTSTVHIQSDLLLISLGTESETTGKPLCPYHHLLMNPLYRWFFSFVKLILHRFIYLFSRLVHTQNGNEITLKKFCVFNCLQGVYTWLKLAQTAHWCAPSNKDLIQGSGKSLEIFPMPFAGFISGCVGATLSSASYHILITRERKG